MNSSFVVDHAFLLAAFVIALGCTAGLLTGAIHAAVVRRKSARAIEAANIRAIAEAEEQRKRLTPQRSCQCGHARNYHSRFDGGCWSTDDRGPHSTCRCAQFDPAPPIFDPLDSPDAFEDREDDSATIGRAS